MKNFMKSPLGIYLGGVIGIGIGAVIDLLFLTKPDSGEALQRFLIYLAGFTVAFLILSLANRNSSGKRK